MQMTHARSGCQCQHKYTMTSKRTVLCRASRDWGVRTSTFHANYKLTPRNRLRIRPTAGLLGDFVTTSTICLAAVCALGQAVKLVRVREELQAYKRQPQDDSTNLRWGVMGVISFLPLFNWMAWVLAALDTEVGGSIYYSLAALYLVPLLRNGFDQDLYSLTMLVIGALHVQLARVAETEPDTVIMLSVPRVIGRAVLGLQRRLALLPTAIKVAEELQEFEDDEKSQEFMQQIERRDMSEFDNKLQRKEKDVPPK